MAGYFNRAMSAYFRSGGTAQPQKNEDIEKYNGREYMVLRNCNGILAVYRITCSGQLKRLKRWPSEISEEF